MMPGDAERGSTAAGVAAAAQQLDLGRVGGEGHGAFEGGGSLVVAAEPVEGVAPGRVQQVVAVERVGEGVEGSEGGGWPVPLAHGDGPVQGDDRRR